MEMNEKVHANASRVIGYLNSVVLFNMKEDSDAIDSIVSLGLEVKASKTSVEVLRHGKTLSHIIGGNGSNDSARHLLRMAIKDAAEKIHAMEPQNSLECADLVHENKE